MRLPLTIRGVDCSSLAQKYGYTLSYSVRSGSNGGMMLDGSQTIDILAYKAVISVDMNPMSDAECSQLLSLVQRNYVTVTYFDIKTNSVRTAEFIPKIGTASPVILRDGKKVFDGMTLTLEER